MVSESHGSGILSIAGTSGPVEKVKCPAVSWCCASATLRGN